MPQSALAQRGIAPIPEGRGGIAVAISRTEQLRNTKIFQKLFFG